LGLRQCLLVDSIGLCGGLGLFWDESINVTLLSQGERYLMSLLSKIKMQAPGGQLLLIVSLVLKKGKNVGYTKGFMWGLVGAVDAHRRF
jgi:hypothetical protein